MLARRARGHCCLPPTEPTRLLLSRSQLRPALLRGARLGLRATAPAARAAPARIYVQDEAAPVARLVRAPDDAATCAAVLQDAALIVEGWLLDAAVLDDAVQRVNEGGFAGEKFVPGYVAYLRVLAEFRKERGFRRLDL